MIATLRDNAPSICPATETDWIDGVAAAHHALAAVAAGMATITDALPTIRAAQSSCVFAAEEWRTSAPGNADVLTLCGRLPQALETAIEFVTAGGDPARLDAVITAALHN